VWFVLNREACTAAYQAGFFRLIGKQKKAGKKAGLPPGLAAVRASRQAVK